MGDPLKPKEFKDFSHDMRYLSKPRGSRRVSDKPVAVNFPVSKPTSLSGGSTEPPNARQAYIADQMNGLTSAPSNTAEGTGQRHPGLIKNALHDTDPHGGLHTGSLDDKPTQVGGYSHMSGGEAHAFQEQAGNKFDQLPAGEQAKWKPGGNAGASSGTAGLTSTGLTGISRPDPVAFARSQRQASTSTARDTDTGGGLHTGNLVDKATPVGASPVTTAAPSQASTPTTSAATSSPGPSTSPTSPSAVSASSTPASSAVAQSTDSAIAGTGGEASSATPASSNGTPTLAANDGSKLAAPVKPAQTDPLAAASGVTSAGDGRVATPQANPTDGSDSTPAATPAAPVVPAAPAALSVPASGGDAAPEPDEEDDEEGTARAFPISKPGRYATALSRAASGDDDEEA